MKAATWFRFVSVAMLFMGMAVGTFAERFDVAGYIVAMAAYFRVVSQE